MARKNITLLGAMADAIKSINTGEIPDMKSVEESIEKMIEEKVNKTYVTSLSAETVAPTTMDDEGTEMVFCNGTAVVIKAREDGEDGADLLFPGSKISVGPNANIFGGRHDDDTLTNSSITMEGGTVRNIIGGGLHKSHTVIANVTIKGGTVTSVQGGGASSLTKTCGCANATWYAGDYSDSPCLTEEANVVVTGGKITTLLYGGGEGISCTKKATIIFGGNAEAYYVTPGGSNGGTEIAKTTIKGGTVKLLQAINRGYEKEVTMNIEGGEIEKVYAGGEVPFAGSKESPKGSDASGIFDSLNINITNGHIGSLYWGGNDYVEITPDSEDAKKVTINIKDKSIIDANAIV